MLILVKKVAEIALEVAVSVAVAGATYYINDKLYKTSKQRKRRARKR